MYRKNVNINDLINRYEPPSDDDLNVSESVKYVRPSKKYKLQSFVGDDENFGIDENRSLMKFTDREKFFNRSVFTRHSSGVKEFIKQMLYRISTLLEMISKFPFPRMSVMSFGLTSLLAVFIAPRSFTDRALYPGFKILFTIIYPAYRSFKAVRNKNLKEYLKWIVYWIVYAFFTCLELITDALLNWFPFYNEIKVIFLIWLLGPSTRGAMKVYKNVIHPMLISREQEIDDVIQLAQDHGYMQVFRLSSKSVNYANKIIMQDAKTDSSFLVSHQLMRSLSNISDAGTIQSNDDNEEALRMRRYSIDKVPLYNYEDSESRRKPSFDYNRYDDMMSSGYASPTPSFYRNNQSQNQKAFIEENQIPRRSNSISESKPRATSLRNLTEDDIILAYNNLQAQKNSAEISSSPKKVENDESYQEFLKWKQNNEKTATMSVIKENIITPALSIDEKMKKVMENVKNDESLNVVTKEEEPEIDIADEKAVKVDSDSEFDEFKDTIDEEDDKNDLLNVPLVILEESDIKHEEIKFDEVKESISECKEDITDIKEESVIVTEAQTKEINNIANNSEPKEEISRENSESVQEMIPTVIEEKLAQEANVVEAKLTLTNDPLQIMTSLSSSSVSLASTDDNKKRPAKHSKGRAPPPPQASSASNLTTNVNDGYYYDELTKKHFKETEL